jgi:sulfur-carrier protein
MSIPVRIPTPLRKLTQNQEIVEVDGVTIRDVIDNLEKAYPGLKERICDEEDNVRRFVNVFVNEVSIVPAIAGG